MNTIESSLQALCCGFFCSLLGHAQSSRVVWGFGGFGSGLGERTGPRGVGMRAFGFSLRVGAGRGSRERRSGQEQGSRISEVCDDIKENETLK